MHAYRPSTNSRSLALKILSSLFQISFRNLWYFSFYFPSVLGVFINPKMKEPSVNTGVKNRTCWWIWAPVDRLPRHEWGGRVFARRDDTPHARIASGPTLGRLPECVLFFKSYHLTKNSNCLITCMEKSTRPSYQHFSLASAESDWWLTSCSDSRLLVAEYIIMIKHVRGKWLFQFSRTIWKP